MYTFSVETVALTSDIATVGRVRFPIRSTQFVDLRIHGAVNFRQ